MKNEKKLIYTMCGLMLGALIAGNPLSSLAETVDLEIPVLLKGSYFNSEDWTIYDLLGDANENNKWHYESVAGEAALITKYNNSNGVGKDDWLVMNKPVTLQAGVTYTATLHVRFFEYSGDTERMLLMVSNSGNQTSNFSKDDNPIINFTVTSANQNANMWFDITGSFSVETAGDYYFAICSDTPNNSGGNYNDSAVNKLTVTYDSEAAPEQPGTEPEEPVDPEEPGTDPEEPGEEPTVEPEEPGTEPEEPTVDPEEPGTDLEEPGTDPEEPTVDPEEPGDVNATEVNWIAEDQNYSSDEFLTTIDVNENITITLEQGMSSGAPVYKANGYVEISKDNNVTIEAKNGYKFSMVEFTVSTATYLVKMDQLNIGTYTTDSDLKTTTWTGDADKITFVPSAKARVKSISFFYSQSATEPEEPTVDPEDPGTDPEEPTVDPEEPGTEPDDPTGVSEIGASTSQVEYYTLQGVRVQNPLRGFYIKREIGKSAQRIFIK